MEEKAANAVEMAAQANEERAKIKETAQGWINKKVFLCNYKIRKFEFTIKFNLLSIISSINGKYRYASSWMEISLNPFF